MHFLAALFILAGFALLLSAKSAIHEIEAFIIWLIAAVLSCSASIRDALQRIYKELIPKEREHPETLDIPRRAPQGLWNSIKDASIIIFMVLFLFLALSVLLSKDRSGLQIPKWLLPG